MRAILTFELPEDEDEFRAAINGMKWSLVAWNTDQAFRTALKYGHEHKTADEALEWARKTLRDIIGEYSLSLDDVS